MTDLAMTSQLRLLRTPKPQARESLPGYLLRLTEQNSYDSPRWIPEKAGLKVDPKRGDWTDLWRPDSHISCLREITGLSISELEFLREPLAPDATRQRIPKICPPCLEEGGWCRKTWEVLAFTACPKHRVVLIDHCPGCDDKLSWARSRVSICVCGYDWRGIRVLDPATGRELAVARRLLHLWYGDRVEESGDEETSPHPLGTDGYTTALCTLIDAWLYLQDGRRLKTTTPARSCHTAAVAVMGALGDWPEGFFRFCGRYETSSLRKLRLAMINSPHKALQWTAGWMAIAGALDEYLDERWREDGISPAMVLLMSKEEVARRLDLSIGQVERLIKVRQLGSIASVRKRGTVWIDSRSFKKFREYLRTTMPTARAAEILGIWPGQMRDLMRRGLLVPDAGFDVGVETDLKFSLTALEAFGERICSLIKSADGNGEEDLIHLGQIAESLMKHELSFGQFIEDVMAGAPLPVFAQSENTEKLSRIWFRVDDFSRYLDLRLDSNGWPTTFHYTVPSLRGVVTWLDRRQSEGDRFYRNNREPDGVNHLSEYGSPCSALQLLMTMKRMKAALHDEPKNFS